nr:leaf rust 10 disease-resistance locus receptor-like protein kinase-like 1.1 [Tanacetum cinerariifolium]
MPVRNKSILIETDNFSQAILYSISQNLAYVLVENIAEAIGLKSDTLSGVLILGTRAIMVALISSSILPFRKKSLLAKQISLPISHWICLHPHAVFFVFIIWRRCKGNPFTNASLKNKTPDLEDSLCCGVSIFSYTELKEATGNFSPSHELGDGGFKAVYYGKLQDGREVAVKRLYEHNYKRAQQFINEEEILTRLRHPNLVVLYGCTSQQSHELLIVYEYIPNGTIADHLHREQAKPTLLTWPIRMKIAIKTASALVYLHASEIIHRDVKTNNILLDHSFSVKLADFGLSRLVPNNATHVSTAPQGTPGYLDPQYHQRYQLIDKSDVYRFGVVLIELISSMVAVDLNRSQDEVSLANLALNRI